ncbi:hypothetical protein N7451_011986 [Penicillium sp. IBT 35674x]|nr:hypothetical protein N7451_011986 [Penicillium sp. IBT 35674x]
MPSKMHQTMLSKKSLWHFTQDTRGNRATAQNFSQRHSGTVEQVDAEFYTCATLSLDSHYHSSALVPGLLLAWPWTTRTSQAAEVAFLLAQRIDDIGDIRGQLIGDSEFGDDTMDIQT